MTDETENQVAANQTPDDVQTAAPSMRVLAQYTKDVSFENPNAPASLRDGPQPKIDLQLDVAARVMEDPTVFEVELKIKAKSERDDQVIFMMELVYAGLFQFSNIPQENMEPMLLIECPRILFPFARQIMGDLSASGGFPPMLVDPMDFAALYYSQRQPARADA